MKLNELSRIDTKEVDRGYMHWASFYHIYDLFSKVDDRAKLLDKYKKMMKIMKPGKGRAALTFFYRIRRDEIDKQLSTNVPGVRAVFEFEEDMNSYKSLRIGQHQHKRSNSTGWKILKFISSKGDEGARFTDIQHFIYVTINGGTEEDFWEKGDNWAYDERNNRHKIVQRRKTRGYWNTNLYGSPGYDSKQKRFIDSKTYALLRFCKKNDKGKWIIDRWPDYDENLFGPNRNN